MFRAKIQHFLGLLEATDVGAGETTALRDQRERAHLDRLIGQTHTDQGAVGLEQRERGIHVDGRRDGVHDEIERALGCLHGLLVGGEQEVIGTQAVAVLPLAGRVADQGDVGSHGVRDLDAHVAEAAEAHDAHALAGAGPPRAQGGVGRDARA